MADADPKGVAEPPNTKPMQAMADVLRGLSVGQHSPEYVVATALASAEMMELMTDWLVDQHRLIKAQSDTVVTLTKTVEELNEAVAKLLRRKDGE